MSLTLLMDAHVAQAITDGLRSRGVDVITAQEDESDALDDPLLLDRATELGRVLFTQDEDFFAITAERQVSGEPFAGVIYAHQARVPIGQCIDQLELMAIVYDPPDMANLLKRIPIR